MNSGANAYGERTVSTKQPQVTDLTSVDNWASSNIGSERYWASFLVTKLFHKATGSQCDHFVAATYVFVVWNFTRLIPRLKIFFPASIWWGSTQLQCIYYLRRILICRPPRVFRRFKRRSCNALLTDHTRTNKIRLRVIVDMRPTNYLNFETLKCNIAKSENNSTTVLLRVLDK